MQNGGLEPNDPLFKNYKLETLSWAMRRCSSAAHVVILRQLHTRASSKLKTATDLLAVIGDGHWDESKGPTPAEQVKEARATMVTCVDAIHWYRVQTADTYRDPVELRSAQDCKIDGRSSRAAFKKRVYCQLNNLSFHNRDAEARKGKEAEAQEKIRERAGVEVVLEDNPDETDDDGLIQDDVPQTSSRVISKEWLQQNMEQWEDECNEELARHRRLEGQARDDPDAEFDTHTGRYHELGFSAEKEAKMLRLHVERTMSEEYGHRRTCMTWKRKGHCRHGFYCTRAHDPQYQRRPVEQPPVKTDKSYHLVLKELASKALSTGEVPVVDEEWFPFPNALAQFELGLPNAIYQMVLATLKGMQALQNAGSPNLLKQFKRRLDDLLDGGVKDIGEISISALAALGHEVCHKQFQASSPPKKRSRGQDSQARSSDDGHIRLGPRRSVELVEEQPERRRKLPKGRLPPTSESRSSGSASGSGHCPTTKRTVIKKHRLKPKAKPGRISLRHLQSDEAWRVAGRIKAFYGGYRGLKKAAANAQRTTNYEVVDERRRVEREDIQ